MATITIGAWQVFSAPSMGPILINENAGSDGETTEVTWKKAGAAISFRPLEAPTITVGDRFCNLQITHTTGVSLQIFHNGKLANE